MKKLTLFLIVSSFIISGCVTDVIPSSNGIYSGTNIVSMEFESGSAEFTNYDMDKVSADADSECRSRGFRFAKFYNTRTTCEYYLVEAGACARDKTAIIFYCK